MDNNNLVKLCNIYNSDGGRSDVYFDLETFIEFGCQEIEWQYNRKNQYGKYVNVVNWKFGIVINAGKDEKGRRILFVIEPKNKFKIDYLELDNTMIEIRKFGRVNITSRQRESLPGNK